MGRARSGRRPPTPCVVAVTPIRLVLARVPKLREGVSRFGRADIVGVAETPGPEELPGFVCVGASVPPCGTCAGRHRGRGPTSTGSRRHHRAGGRHRDRRHAGRMGGVFRPAATGVDAGVARGAAGARREGVTRTSPSLRSDRVSPAVTDHDHCLRMTAPTPSASDAGIGHRPRLLAVIAIRRGLARPSSRCGARGSGARGASESARVRAAHRCAQR